MPLHLSTAGRLALPLLVVLLCGLGPVAAAQQRPDASPSATRPAAAAPAAPDGGANRWERSFPVFLTSSLAAFGGVYAGAMLTPQDCGGDVPDMCHPYFVLAGFAGGAWLGASLGSRLAGGRAAWARTAAGAALGTATMTALLALQRESAGVGLAVLLPVSGAWLSNTLAQPR